MALPTPTTAASKTVFGRRNLVTITPSGGSATTYLVKKVSHSPNIEKIERRSPSSDGKILRVNRTVLKSRKDEIKITLDEFHSDLINLLLNNTTGQCTAVVYIVDPDDAANTPSYSIVKKTTGGAFTAVATLDGEINFDQEGEGAEISFMLTATEDIEIRLDTSV